MGREYTTRLRFYFKLHLVCRYWWALKDGMMVLRSLEGEVEEEVTKRGRYGMGGGIGGP